MNPLNPTDNIFREAAFAHVRMLLGGRSVLTRNEVSIPFFVNGKRLTLVDPQRGIHKPQAMSHLLSITTVVPAKGRKVWYDDQLKVHKEVYEGEDGILYNFMGSNSNARQNQYLLESSKLKIPVIYFLGIKPGVYQPIFPVYLSDWDEKSLRVKVLFTDDNAYLSEAHYPRDEIRRRYALRTVKQRLHQSCFREAVLDAYNNQCCISRLKASPLIEAAHIIPDSDVIYGLPQVSNGLALSKIHHAAYDANLIGISPDGEVLISDKLTALKDHSPLAQTLIGHHRQKIKMPLRSDDFPNKDFLDTKYQLFKSSI